MQVQEIMKTDLVVTTPEATLKEVDELFNLNSISGAPVGILTSLDLAALVASDF